MFGIFVVCKLTNKEIDYYTDKFYDKLTKLKDNVVQQGYNMCEKLGLHDNKNIYEAIDELLYDKYNIHNMTLLEMYELTKIEYTAVTMCMNTRKAIYLNYKSYPDLHVGKAVQMSSAVPFFFIQVKWNNMIFADGGVVNNMPIDYYDYDNGKFNDETLGIHFLSSEPDKYKCDTVLSMLEGIENAQIINNEQQSIQTYTLRHIIEINVGNIDAFNFDLSEKEKSYLLNNGYNSVIMFFEKNKNIQRSWNDWFKSWIW